MVGGSARDLIFFLIFFVIAPIAAAIIKDAPVIGKLSDAYFPRPHHFYISVAPLSAGIHSRLSMRCFTRRSEADERFRRAREGSPS